MALKKNLMYALVKIWQNRSKFGKIGQNLAILLKKSGFRPILAIFHDFEAHQRFFRVN